MTNKQTMVKDGFTAFEADILLKGWKAAGGMDSPAFVAMRESRRQWWVTLLGQGWTRRQIWKAIRNWYKSPKHDPFEWLRESYQPAKRITKEQYRVAAKRRKKATRATKVMFHLSKTKPKQPVTVTLKGKRITF